MCLWSPFLVLDAPTALNRNPQPVGHPTLLAIQHPPSHLKNRKTTRRPLRLHPPLSCSHPAPPPPAPPPPPRYDDQFIAQGAFCAVFKCEYQGHSVVAKRVRQDLPLAARREALTCLWKEFECLQPLTHPNIIEAYGMWWVACCGSLSNEQTRAAQAGRQAGWQAGWQACSAKMFRLFAAPRPMSVTGLLLLSPRS